MTLLRNVPADQFPAALQAEVWAAVAAATPRLQFGGPFSPMNRPLSAWAPGIMEHFGVTSIVDTAATASLYSLLTTGVPSAGYSPGEAYLTLHDNAFATYWSLPTDPLIPLYYSDGTTRIVDPFTGANASIRIPVGAHSWNDAAAGDRHVAFIDKATNRIWSFYSGGSEVFGLTDGATKWRANWFGVDRYKPDSDASMVAATSMSARYSGSRTAIEGVGGGVWKPGGARSTGDSNGYNSPWGVIMPEDLDDTGWSGVAVGTLHHALRFTLPAGSHNGKVWPLETYSGSGPLKNGQLVRLDPEYDVTTPRLMDDNVTWMVPNPWQLRFLRTLQVYGAVVSDEGNYGPVWACQGDWAGLGPRRGANPWLTANGAPPEAQALYTSCDNYGHTPGGTNIYLTPDYWKNGSDWRHSIIPAASMQAILPHGSYAGAAVTP